jgi:hypothetical protein
MPRRRSPRKSRAQRPCCQHVRHTDIRTDCARAPVVSTPQQVVEALLVAGRGGPEMTPGQVRETRRFRARADDGQEFGVVEYQTSSTSQGREDPVRPPGLSPTPSWMGPRSALWGMGPMRCGPTAPSSGQFDHRSEDEPRDGQTVRRVYCSSHGRGTESVYFTGLQQPGIQCREWSVSGLFIRSRFLGVPPTTPSGLTGSGPRGWPNSSINHRIGISG